MVREALAQAGEHGGPIRADDQRGQRRTFIHHGGSGAHHPRALSECRFDLAYLDTSPADLDLAVDAPEELEYPIGSAAYAVAGAIHPGARGAKGIRREPGRSQARRAEVRVLRALAPDVQLTDRAVGHGYIHVVQHVESRPADRRADRHA